MALQITLTTAGIAEIVNAENMGTDPVTIDAIGLGTGQYTPAASQTALVSETKQLTTIAGEVVADDTIHVTIKDESTDAYDVGEFGLYTDSGTLLAVYSQPSGSGWILQKAAGSTLLLSVDIKLDSIDAASLTFGDVLFSNPPASETVIGVIEIADATETQAGTDDTRAMTPAKDVQAWDWHLAGYDQVLRRHKAYTGDANDIDHNSCYGVTISNVTNLPGGLASWGFLTTMMHGANPNYATQVIWSMNNVAGNEAGWFRQLNNSVWGAWQEIMHSGKYATLAEAQAGADGTKVMTPVRVHDAFEKYGLGDAGAAEFSGSVNDNALANGIYHVQAGATGTKPFGANTFRLLIMKRNGNAEVTQIAWHNSADLVAFRRYLSGAWSAWVTLLGSDLYATQAEAEGGSNATKLMTPLRSEQLWNVKQGGFSVSGRHSSYSGNLNSILVNSVYNFNTADCSNYPSGMAGWGFITTNMHTSSTQYASQTLLTMNTAAGQRVWTRQRIADSWGSWEEVANTANMPRSFTGNGYHKLHTGLIIQWGSVNIANNTPVQVTLPIAFPTAHLRAYASGDLNVLTGGVVNANNYSLTQIELGSQYSIAENVAWLSIGH